MKRFLSPLLALTLALGLALPMAASASAPVKPSPKALEEFHLLHSFFLEADRFSPQAAYERGKAQTNALQSVVAQIYSWNNSPSNTSSTTTTATTTTATTTTPAATSTTPAAVLPPGRVQLQAAIGVIEGLVFYQEKPLLKPFMGISARLIPLLPSGQAAQLRLQRIYIGEGLRMAHQLPAIERWARGGYKSPVPSAIMPLYNFLVNHGRVTARAIFYGVKVNVPKAMFAPVLKEQKKMDLKLETFDEFEATLLRTWEGTTIGG